jgi:hypothetical protein
MFDIRETYDAAKSQLITFLPSSLPLHKPSHHLSNLPMLNLTPFQSRIRYLEH